MDRVRREEIAYNEGLNRKLWKKFGRQGYYENRQRNDLFKQILNNGSLRILEIGCSKWNDAICNNSHYEHDITCINISNVEIDAAKKYFSDIKLKPKYINMDAHQLAFEDNSFDLIFGFGMLHHLDYEIALKEINRCLKPNGRAIFREPLDINPVSTLIRNLTPKARTDDEKPFKLSDIKKIRGSVHMKDENYEQLLTFLVTLITSKFSKHGNNIFIWAAFKIDNLIKKILPGSKYLFRSLTLVFSKKC